MAPLASSVAVLAAIKLRFANAVIVASSVSGRRAGARKSAHQRSVAARCVSGDSARAAQQIVRLNLGRPDRDVEGGFGDAVPEA